jgi:hypothetical protein
MDKFIINEDEKNRILNLHESATKRQYLPEQAKILQNEKIVTNHDRTYDYKKSGEEYFYKLKNADDWTKASGKGLEAIKTKVYKEGGSTNPTLNVGKSKKPFPFTTKEEGDKFRAWVNKYYPKTSKSLQLDPTGPFNNPYIKRAWNSIVKDKEGKDVVIGDIYDMNVLNPTKGKAKAAVKGDAVGKSAYIKDKGGVNVRMSPKVNNGSMNNIQNPKNLYRMFKGDENGKIGEVDSSHKSLEYGDKKTWYKIKLIPMPKPYSTTFQKYGFVREDAITLK